jgi:hypothetical protein
VLFGSLGTIGMILGLFLTIGGWRTAVDLKIEDHEKRLVAAEANQRTYIPVLVGMQKDVSYLAERARRDDDRRDRMQP